MAPMLRVRAVRSRVSAPDKKWPFRTFAFFSNFDRAPQLTSSTIVFILESQHGGLDGSQECLQLQCFSNRKCRRPLWMRVGGCPSEQFLYVRITSLSVRPATLRVARIG